MLIRTFMTGLLLTAITTVSVAQSSTTLEREWTLRWGTDKIDNARDLAVDRYCRVHVTGYETTRELPANRPVIVTREPGGQVLTSRWGAQGETQRGCGVAADHCGNVYVAGEVGDFKERRIFVRKFHRDGLAQWTRRFDIGPNARIWNATMDRSGRLLICGSGQSNGDNSSQAFTASVSASGKLVWLTFLTGNNQSYSNAWGLTVDHCGRLFVTGSGARELGQRPGNTSNGTFLACLNSTDGSLIWIRTIGLAVNDQGADVCVRQNGEVCVLGVVRPRAVADDSSVFAEPFVSPYVAEKTIEHAAGNSTTESNVFWYLSVWTPDGQIKREFQLPISGWASEIVETHRGDLFACGTGTVALINPSTGLVKWTDENLTNTSRRGAVAVDRCGGLYLSATILGPLPPTRPRGGYDMFVIRYRYADQNRH